MGYGKSARIIKVMHGLWGIFIAHQNCFKRLGTSRVHHWSFRLGTFRFTRDCRGMPECATGVHTIAKVTFERLS